MSAVPKQDDSSGIHAIIRGDEVALMVQVGGKIVCRLNYGEADLAELIEQLSYHLAELRAAL